MQWSIILWISDHQIYKSIRHLTSTWDTPSRWDNGFNRFVCNHIRTPHYLDSSSRPDWSCTRVWPGTYFGKFPNSIPRPGAILFFAILVASKWWSIYRVICFRSTVCVSPYAFRATVLSGLLCRVTTWTGLGFRTTFAANNQHIVNITSARLSARLSARRDTSAALCTSLSYK